MTEPLEVAVSNSTIGLPTAWRIVTVIGSVASTVVLVCFGVAFDLVREEWKELRVEVREMRHRLDSMPDGETLNRLSDDVQDLDRRVDRLEGQVNRWDE
jgi:outer membrane murein-binding lipoprotein Lpp